LVFTHEMRRPCWCRKEWQNVAQVLHNNRIKFPLFFAIIRYTNMAAVTSHETESTGEVGHEGDPSQSANSKTLVNTSQLSHFRPSRSTALAKYVITGLV